MIGIGVMELEVKKEHIYRCIKLGMDLSSSMYVAECTYEEMETLEQDLEFQRIVKVHQHMLEKDLLEKHELAMTLAAQRGNTTGIQWKLAGINRERWGTGNKAKDNEPVKPAPVEIYIPDNGRGA